MKVTNINKILEEKIKYILKENWKICVKIIHIKDIIHDQVIKKIFEIIKQEKRNYKFLLKIEHFKRIFHNFERIIKTTIRV